jgi:uncharacterized membrane protein
MIDWKNWRTGAKIGFIYGVICAIYIMPIVIEQYSPNPNVLTKIGEDYPYSWYQIIGIIIFFPVVVIVAFAVGESFQGLPIFEIISISSIMVVIVEIVLGVAVGYLFGWLEKRQTK